MIVSVLLMAGLGAPARRAPPTDAAKATAASLPPRPTTPTRSRRRR